MKRSDFDKKFNSIVQKVYEPISTKEGVLKMIESYTKNVDKVTQEEMFKILFFESRKYTDELTYRLFKEFLDIED